MCPYYKNKEVFDSFNEMVEAFGGKPLTEEEFKSSELRKLRTGQNLFAMEAAYRCYHLNNGNFLDKAPNGEDSILFLSLLDRWNGDRLAALREKGKVYSDNFLNWFGDWTGNYQENFDSQGVKKEVLSNGKIRLSLSTHSDEHPRQIVLEPQGDNKYYVHIRIWDGEKIPGKISDTDKQKLFNALYKELPVGAEILFPKSEDGYYATRGTVAGLMRLERDKRFKSGEKGTLLYKDKDGSIKEYSGTSFIKLGTTSVSKAVDKNGEPLVLWHGTENIFDVFEVDETGKRGAHKVHDRHSFFFTDTKEKAFKYRRAETMPVYLKMDNPGESSVYDGKFNTLNEYTERENEIIRDPQYDSAIFVRYDKEGDRRGMVPTKQWVVKNPNLIKSIDNFGTFSKNSDNIYHNLPLSTQQIVDNVIYRAVEHGILSRQATRPNTFIFKTELDKRTKEYVIPKDVLWVVRQLEEAGAAVNVLKAAGVINVYGVKVNRQPITEDFSKVLLVVSRLTNVFPDLLVELIDLKTANQMMNDRDIDGIDSRANSFVIGNTVYLIKDRVSSTIAVEECLHPFIAALERSNYFLFNSLFELAVESDPKLWERIQKVYTPYRGYTDSDRMNEMIALKMSEILRKKILDKRTRTFRSLIKKFGQWIRGMFIKNGSDFELLPEKIFKISLNDLADILATDNVVVRIKEDQNLRTFNNAMLDKINTTLIEKYNRLYEQYASIAENSSDPNAAVRQELIFRNLSEIRHKSDLEVIMQLVVAGINDIGSYDSDGSILPDPNTVLYQLKKSSQLADPFSDLTAEDVMNIKRYSIGFYKNILQDIPSVKDDVFAGDQNKVLRDKIEELRTAVENAYILWVAATKAVGDRLVDLIIDDDVYASQEVKDRMRIVAKDWLHRNLFYGDINGSMSKFVQMSGNNNLIVRMSMDLIGYAESQRIEEALHRNNMLDKQRRRCLKNLKRGLTPFTWETVFMEFDEHGLPTGNFARERNYGQYQLDFDNFMRNLVDEWDDTYGYHYMELDGEYVNSATLERAVDEEWVNGNPPMYIEWLRRIEEFKALRIHRRYTPEYYREQLTEPYTESLSALLKGVPAKHGLSPKTHQKYNYYVENINFYLDRCVDKETGIPHPERLSAADRAKLLMWQDKKRELENPYEPDGSVKTDEEFQMALEIAAWNKWIASRTGSVIDYDKFYEALHDVERQALRENNPQLVYDFWNLNSTVRIHPEYIPKFPKKWGDNQWMRYSILRQALQNLVQLKNGIGIDLTNFISNPTFFVDAKQTEAMLDLLDSEYIDKSITKEEIKKLAQEYDSKIKQVLAPYIDLFGRTYTKNAFDSNGNPTEVFDPNIHNKNDILSWYDYVLNYYTKLAFNNGYIDGLYSSTGQLVSFAGKSEAEIRNIIDNNLLSVLKIRWVGNMRTLRKTPLSIFFINMPTLSTFIASDGKLHKTIEHVPNGGYLRRAGSIIDPQFNPEDGESYVPSYDFDNGRYDNRKNFSKITSDPELNKMYNMLIGNMKHSWRDLGMQSRKFNYRLPQIEASYNAILSRVGRLGLSKTIELVQKKMTTVQLRDENMRTNELLIKMADGTEAENLPKRYLDLLEDRSMITTNVIGAVALFNDMALNYKYKYKVQHAIEVFRENMRDEFRQQAMPSSPEYTGANGRELYDSAESSEELMKYLLDTQVYGNETEGGFGEHRDSVLYTVAMKAMRSTQRLETVVMLGLNAISIAVGLGSSLLRLLKEAIMGRYLTPRDLASGFANVLSDLPMILANMGNSQVNNKTGALMQIFGISKSQYQTYINMSSGRISKFLGNLLMGGYSMLDWWANAIVLSSYMHNVRFYDGDKIPKGFYSGYEMKQKFKEYGYSKAVANYEYMMCHTTLYGAYKYINGTCIVKEKYRPYVTPRVKKQIRSKTAKRVALYNGVTPDNDEIYAKKTLLGRLVFALRGFMLTQAHHLFGGLTKNGYDDTTVYQVKNTPVSKVRNGRPIGTREITKTKRANSDNALRMGWDFETGTPQDDIFHNLARAVNTSFIKIAYALSSSKSSKDRKFSQAEYYAAIDALVYMGIMVGLMVAWPPVHEWAQSRLVYPKTPQLAGFVESFGNGGMNYINNGIYAAQIDMIMMRMNIEQLTNVDPTTTFDFITSMTALYSGAKDTFFGPVKLAGDAAGLTGHSPTEFCRPGSAYTYETRLTRGLYRAVGFPDNLHAGFTSRHLTANQKWYSSQYGGIYRSLGYDPKWGGLTSGEKKGKGKKKKGSKSGYSRDGGWTLSTGGYSR